MRKVLGLLLIGLLLMAGVAWGEGGISRAPIPFRTTQTTGAGPANGQVVTWSSSLGRWVAVTGISGNADTVTLGVYTTGAGTVFQPAPVQIPYTSQGVGFPAAHSGSGVWPAERKQTIEEFLKRRPGNTAEKQPGRAPSFESATTENSVQRVDGLESAATQTALFTAASFRT